MKTDLLPAFDNIKKIKLLNYEKPTCYPLETQCPMQGRLHGSYQLLNTNERPFINNFIVEINRLNHNGLQYHKNVL
jgi:hypothetical protein